MATLSKVEVFPLAKDANMGWVLDVLATRTRAVMAQGGTVAMAAPAILEARIPPLVSSWRRLVVCSEAKAWSRRAVRSVTRLVATVAAMIPAATTRRLAERHFNVAVTVE
jgi:hypothetical protein